MPHRQRAAAGDERDTADPVPRPRPGSDTAQVGTRGGGAALVAQAVPHTADPDNRPGLVPGVALRWPRWPASVRSVPWLRGLLSDVVAVVVAVLDVALVTPSTATTASVWLSWLAVAALPLRRYAPFVALLLIIPGFFYGWAQLAAMIALGTLAMVDRVHWRTWVGFALVWASRFSLFPWSDFVAQTWREHVLNGIYGLIVAGMPLAIGLLVTMRAELFARLRQLDRSREREKRLYAATVRSAERAKLAREMHDVVSHQVTLIAMQAGALQVSAADAESREAAETIRVLSTRTLEELRELVGVLRSGGDEEDAQPGLEEVSDLVLAGDVRINLAIDVSPEQLPGPVSRAAYRTVQEALTNVRKHAAGARTSVRVRTEADTLHVDIRNDRPRRRRAPTLPSGGHGLVGLRERATLLGGTFSAARTPEGGFTVSATYPLV
ncbi:sensor histidine kinase [Actinokineospora pegani]|uniref:sensor histidine kinase n=1 Tax=Actinokineospora pegani TaxID=2654637 RepID=UPI0012EAECC4|nr:histidine kinase [Actinokineospora pegani]